MTPQSHFMVVAPIDQNREGELRKLLASMNYSPGVVNPKNDIVPFGQFERLHFARFLILDDQTLNDVTSYGVPRPDFTHYLAFLGDCDGPAGDFRADLVQRAGVGLKAIFSHCQGFGPDRDLLRWMKDHEQPPATIYVNWVGRTVRQILEENALRNALEAYLDLNAPALTGKEPAQIRDNLREFVSAERRAGRLALTVPEPTPLGWQLRNLRHWVGVPLVLLLLTPLLLLYLPIFVYQLRRREARDPEITPRPESDHVRKLAELEDHTVTNQFSALGSLKPGLFRRWTVAFILWILDYAARHIYNRGRLARVDTIHFARWVFLDSKRRMLFASNYDGSLESYMDDFINKAGWGLNLVFSNGAGYPRTNWLIVGGATDEQKFKYFIRRHELPTEVWYDAYPGLTAFDLERNTRIRQGIEKPAMTDAEIREWLRLL